MTNNSLTHFGVKGMKWGVRRNRTSVVRRNPTKKSGDNKSVQSESVFSKLSKSPVYNGLAVYGGQEMATQGIKDMVARGRVDCWNVLKVIGGINVTAFAARDLYKSLK